MVDQTDHDAAQSRPEGAMPPAARYALMLAAVWVPVVLVALAIWTGNRLLGKVAVMAVSVLVAVCALLTAPVFGRETANRLGTYGLVHNGIILAVTAVTAYFAISLALTIVYPR